MATDYGNFHDFCRDSTIPVCNVFQTFKGGVGQGPRSCPLLGIPLSGGSRHLRNLGPIILDGLAILTMLILLGRTQRKRAAVGRREMQLFLIGYMLLSVAETFTIGGFPLPTIVRIGFTGAHIGLITATTWMLFMNGLVGYQIINDGTFVSVFLVFFSTAALCVGTGFITLDTGYNWTGYWNTPTIQSGENREYALYTLYFLAPAVFIFLYGVLSTFLVVRILGELRPLLFLIAAAIFFAGGQVFNFIISVHICNSTSGKIDGSLFEVLLNLLAVTMIWLFWSSITEDDWPTVAPGQEYPTTGEYSMTGAGQYPSTTEEYPKTANYD